MDREYDYDYNMNKSSATKRVRKGAQSQEPLPSAAGSSSTGPQGQERLPPAAGPVSTPKAAPVQAVIAGIPTTVPSPEDPVNMYDVEEFLSNLEVMVRDLTFPLPLFTIDRANNSVTEGHYQASP